MSDINRLGAYFIKGKPMSKEKPTPYQKAIAQKLDIDISSDSKIVASARIRDIVEPAIKTESTSRFPTQKQIDFSISIGIDIESDSFWVGSAKIDERLSEINQKALEELDLKSGDRVSVKKTFEKDGKKHEYEKEYLVSSIGRDQRVYFKGGRGQCAWPSQIVKLG